MTLGRLAHDALKNKVKNRKVLYYKKFLKNLQDFIGIFSSVKSDNIIYFYDKCSMGLLLALSVLRK
ncbi:hypothetical protein A9Z63_02555 [Moraxella lacunata]|uniref:Uncharacterized protein n=1 Tax=Moraxella lacunata TaxID=477 RepID=A0A1B8Q1Z6_MORLA|nr:hypothetical protein A9309_06735 [Moraxella lacunata]OBX64839.1 hypothetical protein A9Z63_02555 [Moraxella lacunata]